MRGSFWLVAALAFSVSCAGADGDSADARGADADAIEETATDAACDPATDAVEAVASVTLWPSGPVFEAKGALADGLAYAERLLPWVSHATGADRPDVGSLAAFGVGNGRVFALLGYPKSGPLNTVHGMVGPTYERGERFFGDYAIELLDASGRPRDFDEAWVARERGGRGAISRERYGAVEIDAFTVAPALPTGGAIDPRTACLLRLISVRNTGTAPTGELTVQVRGRNPAAVVRTGRLLEGSSERTLTTALNVDVTGADRALRTTVAPLDAGAEGQLVLTHCTVEGKVPTEAWRPAWSEALDVARATLAYGLGATASHLRNDLPDERVAGFVAGLHATLTAQTAATGAACPMSQYTRTWARDNIGPALFQLATGDYESVGRLLDYVWGATLIKGDLQNSYDADLDLWTLPPEPAWDTLGPLAVRVGAETPSYLVIMYGLWYRHTGDLEKARERWGLLRRSMLDVRFDVDRLLPWTGDETFRAAMNTAFGLGLDAPHHETSFSLNSTILWLAAARHFVRLAEALGEVDDAAAVQAIAAEMEAKALPRYLLPDGCWSALIDRATGATWPAPFEDASLTPTWTGWLDGDDPRAVANVQCLIDRIGVAPGVLQSPLDPKYVNFPLLPSQEGVFTGMKPGYTLAALTDVGHPDAEAAFNELARSIDAGGNLDEYHLFTADAGLPYPGLTLFYNEQGLEPSDYTAKFRPWEGGIVAAAVLQYLTGWQPDVPSGHLWLRPHLPNGWRRALFDQVRAGDARYALAIERLDDAHVRVELKPHGAGPLTAASLRWDGAGPVTAVDGAGLAVGVARSVERFGRTSTVFDDAPVAGKVVWVLEE